MTNPEMISKAILLMKEECSKYTTYSACDICPFGIMCKHDISAISDEDIKNIQLRYQDMNNEYGG